MDIVTLFLNNCVNVSKFDKSGLRESCSMFFDDDDDKDITYYKKCNTSPLEMNNVIYTTLSTERILETRVDL